MPRDPASPDDAETTPAAEPTEPPAEPSEGDDAAKEPTP